MCSAPLDLISMLEKMPGFEGMNEAMRHLNIQKLGLNQIKATQPYGTLRRNDGFKGRNSVLPGNKSNALDPAKMFREVS